MTLTTAQLVTLCDVPPRMLMDWIREKVIDPDKSGTQGRGKSHLFRPMTALGVVVACRVYTSERGCVPAYVAKVVNAFRAADEADLKAQFAKGKTRLVMIHFGKPFLDGETKFGWVDVKAAYEEVINAK